MRFIQLLPLVPFSTPVIHLGIGTPVDTLFQRRLTRVRSMHRPCWACQRVWCDLSANYSLLFHHFLSPRSAPSPILLKSQPSTLIVDDLGKAQRRVYRLGTRWDTPLRLHVPLPPCSHWLSLSPPSLSRIIKTYPASASADPSSPASAPQPNSRPSSSYPRYR